MLLNPKIFRAYDVRGQAFVDFDEDGLALIAAAFGQYLRTKFPDLRTPNIFVSGDGRLSMGELFPAVLEGARSSGCQVTWGGAMPTPINYFIKQVKKYDGAIQITASHNPPADNGLKLSDRRGSIAGEELQKIRHLSQCLSCVDRNRSGQYQSKANTFEFIDAHRQFITALLPPQNPWNIIIDAGNGITGNYYPAIFQRIGHKVTELFCRLDTNFPNHHPDPEDPANMRFLQQEVKAKKADLGLAFDGDGDRLGVVLSNGQIWSADKIFLVLASDLAQRHPHSTVVIDSMSPAWLATALHQLGLRTIWSPTGHSNIEKNMTEHQALLGGEQSGHFMMGEDFFGNDDASLAGLRFIQALQNQPQLISTINQLTDNFVEINEKIPCSDETKFAIMKIVIELAKKEFAVEQLNFLDGVRVDFGDSQWGILRGSNTSAKIAIRTQSHTAQLLKKHHSQLIKLLTIAQKQI